ncbi:MAG TPA: glycoside hydrolase family 29 [Lentisphaeria bacterium]|nr:MAG: glycoside hydrolase family 29 [Lentisphaerae bacterium GWF2_50_93]HCE45148.1 glycoside hydrolase family 29 [Lentisphaeria bacterium]
MAGSVIDNIAVAEEQLKGAELASKLKSSVVFKGDKSIRDASLKLDPKDMAWWRDAKFGMFIHWGLYAIPARGEWVMNNEKIPSEEYAKLADQFAPKHFDSDRWARITKNAGMKYMVLTARHHDGFALWDSPSSYKEFCSAKTAAKRDFVAEYTAACRKAGLGVGLYYSPMDWRFPGYFQPKELSDNADMMKKQGYGQIEELMSKYGKIDILWYDGGWLAHNGTDADAAWFWEPLMLNKMVRKYQPKAVINPRSGWEGDFQCDEGGHDITGPIINIPWEKCLNLNKSSWGYNKHQNTMSSDEIIRMLINVVGRGGNVLLNVGPDPDGVIPPPHVKILEEVGRWLEENGKGIYGTRPGPFQPVDGKYCSTFKEDKVYIHLLDLAGQKELVLPALGRKIISSSMISGEELSFIQSNSLIRISIPAWNKVKPPAVIELVLDESL